ncbi:cell wall-binding repeat-containing protein [Catenulispora acidiphila]|uniref:cell wall-binding repeat-containing protein n=1 Tax=Catenulispora acidiphila TaxID=304895 RepID=UPI000A05295B|nr:cell wall-binding repeat-containing protein [Catenulispora acidiphila]
MLSSESRRRRLPTFGGLALAAVSAGSLVGLPAAAHAASPATVAPAGAASANAAPTNGPIAYTLSNPTAGFLWHTVNPDGSHDAVVPVGDAGAYDGRGPGSGTNDWVNPAGNAVYSPDGSRVLFEGPDGCDYVADADGTGAVALTTVPAPELGCTRLTSNSDVPELSPPIPVASARGFVWSADGRSIYYDAAGSIGRISADGRTQTKLAVTVPNGYKLLSVAPNGAMAFTDSSATAHIWILDPGATALRDLTTGRDAHYSPTTGRLLVLDQVFPPSGQSALTIFAVDTVNGSRTQVTDPTIEFVQSFTWSPDGTQVAYSGESPNGADRSSTGVFTRSLGGGPRKAVVLNPGVIWVTGWHNGPIAPARAADRIGGADRIATAVDASQWSYMNHGAGGRQASVAVISRSDQFADALGGSALAAQKGGPLLLTATSGLDPRVREELKRVLAPGSVVYVLGGDAALSPAVEQQIKALGFTTRRLAGTDRFATSVLTAQQVSAHPHTVMVATGVQYPDALTAGAAAAQDPNGGVVVLSDDKTLPASVKSYLSGVNPAATKVYGVGGQGVAALKGSFPQWTGKVTPLSGADRYATAAAVASSPLFAANGPVGRIGLATGGGWADALSGGALIATQHGPLLLTNPGSEYLPPSELSLVKALAPHLSGAVAFGGPQALGSVATNTFVSALGGANHFFTYSNRQSPELGGAR